MEANHFHPCVRLLSFLLCCTILISGCKDPCFTPEDTRWLDRVGRRLDPVGKDMDRYGTISVSSPLLSSPSTKTFSFELNVEPQTYFNQAKNEIQGAAGAFYQQATDTTFGAQGKFNLQDMLTNSLNLSAYHDDLNAFQMKNRLLDAAVLASVLPKPGETPTSEPSKFLTAPGEGLAGPNSRPSVPESKNTPPDLSPDTLPTTEEIRKTLVRQQFTDFMKLFGTPPSLVQKNRSAIITAAGDKAVEAMFRFLGRPDLADKFRDKLVLFGVSMVSVNPGEYTTTGFAADVAVFTKYSYMPARIELIRAMEESSDPLQRDRIAFLQVASKTRPVTEEGNKLLDIKTGGKLKRLTEELLKLKADEQRLGGVLRTKEQEISVATAEAEKLRKQRDAAQESLNGLKNPIDVHDQLVLEKERLLSELKTLRRGDDGERIKAAEQTLSEINAQIEAAQPVTMERRSQLREQQYLLAERNRTLEERESKLKPLTEARDKASAQQRMTLRRINEVATQISLFVPDKEAAQDMIKNDPALLRSFSSSVGGSDSVGGSILGQVSSRGELLPDQARNPLVAAVSPMTEVQSLDLSSSIRQQQAFAIRLALVLSGFGAKAEAAGLMQHVDRLEQDVTTRTALNNVASYSNSGGMFGYQIGPDLRALTSVAPGGRGDSIFTGLGNLLLGRRYPGPGMMLQRQTFPVLIAIGIDKHDLDLKIQYFDGRFQIVEPQLEFRQTFRWVPLSQPPEMDNPHRRSIRESERLAWAAKLHEARQIVKGTRSECSIAHADLIRARHTLASLQNKELSSDASVWRDLISIQKLVHSLVNREAVEGREVSQALRNELLALDDTVTQVSDKKESMIGSSPQIDMLLQQRIDALEKERACARTDSLAAFARDRIEMLKFNMIGSTNSQALPIELFINDRAPRILHVIPSEFTIEKKAKVTLIVSNLASIPTPFRVKSTDEAILKLSGEHKVENGLLYQEVEPIAAGPVLLQIVGSDSGGEPIVSGPLLVKAKPTETNNKIELKREITKDGSVTTDLITVPKELPQETIHKLFGPACSLKTGEAGKLEISVKAEKSPPG